MSVDRTLPEEVTANSAFIQGRLPLAGRAFLDPLEQVAVWGETWGANSEVGRLRHAIVRRPGSEFDAVDVSLWDDHLGAAFDPAGRWWWLSKEPPNLDRMQAQHDNLVRTLEGFGIRTTVLSPLEGLYSKSIYMRDPFITVKGGAIVGRLAPQMRRGEEASVTKALAGLGMPILGTIVGRGMVEGGTFSLIRPDLALYATSVRCNQEGAEQLASILGYLGIRLITLPVSGFEFHLDGSFAMIDVDRALIVAEITPHWLPELLRENGIHPIWVPLDQKWAINGLTIEPGHYLMSNTASAAAEKLDRLGIRITTIDYDAIELNGGGIHCSTNELLRDDVD